MPLAVVLYLDVKDELNDKCLGPYAHAWLFSQLLAKLEGDQDWAGRVHDMVIKPFTITGIMGSSHHSIPVHKSLVKSDPCYIRFTILDPVLEILVKDHLEWMFKKKKNGVLLGNQVYDVLDYTWDSKDHEWAGQVNYDELCEFKDQIYHSRETRLEFYSPSLFRMGQGDIPLPLPASVFTGYFNRWNQFAPAHLKLDPLWPEFIRGCLVVSHLGPIWSEKVEFAGESHGRATGFKGEVEFTLLPKKNVPLKWQPFWDGADHVLQTLSRFAFYCGTGEKTTWGLGMTRPVALKDQFLSGRGK